LCRANTVDKKASCSASTKPQFASVDLLNRFYDLMRRLFFVDYPSRSPEHSFINGRLIVKLGKDDDVKRPFAQQVRNQRAGFFSCQTKVEQKNIDVRLGQRYDLGNLSLKVGGLEEVVEVVGSAPTIDTSSTTVGGVLDSDALKRLPVGRNFTDTLYVEQYYNDGFTWVLSGLISSPLSASVTWVLSGLTTGSVSLLLMCCLPWGGSL